MEENEPNSSAPEADQAKLSRDESAELQPVPPNPTETKEDAPMLDVHPPHQPIHTWKEYLLHMSTIVLGLLIAIGLEQGVEAIHRAHERSELRESLRREAEKAIADAEGTERTEKVPLDWLAARGQLVRDALASHKALGAALPRAPHVSSTLPIDPAWNAAKVSGLLPLLTQEEVQVYSQADTLFATAERDLDEGVAAAKKRGAFESKHADPRNMEIIDLSSLTPAELNEYLDLLTDELIAWDQYRVICQYVRGSETAILGGERDLGKVQKAMYQFYSRKAH